MEQEKMAQVIVDALRMVAAAIEKSAATSKVENEDLSGLEQRVSVAEKKIEALEEGLDKVEDESSRVDDLETRIEDVEGKLESAASALA